MQDGAICTFDPFGRRRYCYTFENKCLEVPDLVLGDGTRKLFLSTEGENAEETRLELVDFLHYVKDSVHLQPQTDLGETSGQTGGLCEKGSVNGGEVYDVFGS